MDYLRAALALITVFGLLGLLYLFSKQAKTKAPRRLFCARSIWPRFRNTANELDSDSLHVLRRVSLTPTHQVHLIRTGEEMFLVCTHPRGCTLLRASDAAPAEHGSATSEGLKRYAS